MKAEKVVKTAEEFKNMSSSEICKLMDTDKRFWIVENENEERYIIRKSK
jgi:hypothetical protein